MAIFDSILGWLGMQDREEIEASEISANTNQKTAKKNLVSIYPTNNMKVKICEPEIFEEVQALADNLKNGCQVILNINSASPEEAKRMIDFIAGVVYALNGQSQQLDINLFLFVPSNVEISLNYRLAKKQLINTVS
jgi:cell division inhibitor SepF